MLGKSTKQGKQKERRAGDRVSAVFHRRTSKGLGDKGHLREDLKEVRERARRLLRESAEAPGWECHRVGPQGCQHGLGQGAWGGTSGDGLREVM